MSDLEAKAPSTTALATKAREWWRRDRGFTEPKPGDIYSLVRLLCSVAATAREEALEEAAKKCEELGAKFAKSDDEDDRCLEPMCGFVAERIRALAGRKEER